jgi:hypothetical protein
MRATAGAATLADEARKEFRVLSARWLVGRREVNSAGRIATGVMETPDEKERDLSSGFTAAPDVVPTAAKAIRMLNDARQGICNCCGL